MTDILLSADPLSIDTCYAAVQDPTCGGICLFVGTIRNHNKGKVVTHLDFESYAPMAEKEMRRRPGANTACIQCHYTTEPGNWPSEILP
jgi:molybdopterin synthase catalytic subunit